MDQSAPSDGPAQAGAASPDGASTPTDGGLVEHSPQAAAPALSTAPAAVLSPERVVVLPETEAGAASPGALSSANLSASLAVNATSSSLAAPGLRGPTMSVQSMILAGALFAVVGIVMFFVRRYLRTSLSERAASGHARGIDAAYMKRYGMTRAEYMAKLQEKEAADAALRQRLYGVMYRMVDELPDEERFEEVVLPVGSPAATAAAASATAAAAGAKAGRGQGASSEGKSAFASSTTPGDGAAAPAGGDDALRIAEDVPSTSVTTSSAAAARTGAQAAAGAEGIRVRRQRSFANQGLSWADAQLKRDDDGDEAHEFLGPF